MDEECFQPEWVSNMRTSVGVAVTGLGIVSSIGGNVADFTRSLRDGRCGVGFLKRRAVGELPTCVGAEIAEFSLMPWIARCDRGEFEKEVLERARQALHGGPFGVQVSTAAALEAWTQAQLLRRGVPSRRMGIVVAGSNLNQGYVFDAWLKYQKLPQCVSPKYSMHYWDTDHVGVLSEVLGIRGEGFSVGGASASGNVAIIKAWQLIQLEAVDVCLVVGAMADLSPVELQGYFNVGAMGGRRFRECPDEACRPFDEDHEGFVYGEAAGCLVLESVQSAKGRGVPVLAEVLGTSLLLDGNRLANPNKDGEVQAMEEALRQARVPREEIDYVNAHGSSSPLGDETEVQAMKEVFRGSLPRLWINSTKGLMGHCLTAAGVVEAIAVVVQMQHGFVHPNRNLVRPIDLDCRFCPAQSIEAPIRRVMKNSFGFGGINSAVVFGKGDSGES